MSHRRHQRLRTPSPCTPEAVNVPAAPRRDAARDGYRGVGAGSRRRRRPRTLRGGRGVEGCQPVGVAMPLAPGAAGAALPQGRLHGPGAGTAQASSTGRQNRLRDEHAAGFRRLLASRPTAQRSSAATRRRQRRRQANTAAPTGLEVRRSCVEGTSRAGARKVAIRLRSRSAAEPEWPRADEEIGDPACAEFRRVIWRVPLLITTPPAPRNSSPLNTA